ncbi:MAG: hypothetical protein Q4C42_07790 [Clostridia bacterium]|nr:hypothetical protein [Clostridia bacterium]
MSYACIKVNKNGAAVAADSRISFGRLHLDKGRKSFVSSQGKMVFAYVGLFSYTFENFGKSVYDFMYDDNIPLSERINLASSYIKMQTLRIKTFLKDDSRSDIIFAGYENGEIITGTVMLRNGTEKRKIYRNPSALVLEAGKNSAELSTIKIHVPSPDIPVEDLRKEAEKRVTESIEYDRTMKQQNRKYYDTVGGRIQSFAIRW